MIINRFSSCTHVLSGHLDVKLTQVNVTTELGHLAPTLSGILPHTKCTTVNFRNFRRGWCCLVEKEESQFINKTWIGTLEPSGELGVCFLSLQGL